MKIVSVSLFLVVFLTSEAVCQNAKKLSEFNPVNCEFYLAQMDFAVHHAVKSPEDKVYFLIYEGREEVWSKKKKSTVSALPAKGTFAAKVQSMKNYISRVRQRPLNQFEFISAGGRENLTVEVWLVPKGTDPPTPTPTVSKLVYRNAKPLPFCIGCCE